MSEIEEAQADTRVTAPEQFHQDKELSEPTSRICVKNLPKNVDENRLREHFSARGEVTDAKIMRTRDGKSRCFGFIGYASAKQAEDAVKYFNRSFMDSSRLVVEFAFKYGQSDNRPRAWSKYTEGTSANKRVALQSTATGANTIPVNTNTTASKAAGKKRKQEPGPEEQDPKLQEFLELMAPRSKKPIWANDDIAAATGGVQQQHQSGGDGENIMNRENVALAEDNDSDDELYEELPNNKDASDVDMEEDENGGDTTAKDAAVVDQGVSDMDYLRSRMKRNFDEENAVNSDNYDEDIEDDSDDEEFHSLDDDDGDETATSGDDEDEKVETDTTKKKNSNKAILDKDDFAAAIDEAEEEDGDIEGIFSGKKSSLKKDKEDIDDDENNNDEDNNTALNNERREIAPDTPDPRAVISETGRLFVRNLPYTATEEDLKTLFEGYGEVKEAHVVHDRLTRRSKGFAMIQYEDPSAALEAFIKLDGSIFMGRLLHILPGKAAPPPPEATGDGDDTDNAQNGTSSYKRQKEADMKAGASDNKAAWNSLFMRSDTVAEAVAAHFGVTKAELLDRNAPDMAVRLALGETQVIAKTKKDLGDAGVNIGSLESAAGAAGKAASNTKIKRSDKALLIKNLPYSTDPIELQNLFTTIGPLSRFVLPSTNTLALVEFLEGSDARKAFKSLAYKRYQHVPLYMEWAPVDVFSSPPPEKPLPLPSKITTTSIKDKPSNNVGNAKATGEVLTATAVDDENVESSTIFVKNLAFKTVESSLSKHFEKTATANTNKANAIRSVKITKRKGADGKMLSAGFGFVECVDETTARELIKLLQGSALDGHKLVLQLAQNKEGSTNKKKTKGISTGGEKELAKIVVRNVAFEATRKDIMGLFTPFGQVKSCRLPRKFDGTPRGFAFVEFATPKEASNAVEAVQGTHLYGRRLVIEWAEEDGGLDELRAKTAKKFVDSAGTMDPADRY